MTAALSNSSYQWRRVRANTCFLQNMCMSGTASFQTAAHFEEVLIAVLYIHELIDAHDWLAWFYESNAIPPTQITQPILLFWTPGHRCIQ